METVRQHLTLDFNRDNYDQVFNVYLDNESRELVADLYDNGIRYVPDESDLVELWITFTDDNVTKIAGRVEQGQVYVLLTETSTAIPGLAECRIVIINGTQQLSSGAFTMAIGESIASDIELLKKDYSDVRLAALAIQQLIADESEIRADITSKHEETLSAKDTAVAAKDTAVLAASSAEASETAAAASKSGADTAKEAAITAQNAAETAAQAAALSASSAEASETAATQSAGAAATSKTGADSARDTAVAARDTAVAAAQAVQPWKPTVSSAGDLSWAQDTDLTPPTAQNIKGPKGDKGDKGPQGQNLITNSNGLLGDNTNFTGFNFTGAEAAGGASGSFYHENQGSSRKIVFCDEYFPIDTTKNYKFSFFVKSTVPKKMYSFVDVYDVDKNSIVSDDVTWIKDTTTTLVHDLKDGDTEIHLASLEKWSTTTGNDYYRGFIFWNYKNSRGYEYPLETYSRNNYHSLYDESGVDKENNIISLKSPWAHGTYPAGTAVSQIKPGGTYTYGPLNNTDIPQVWTHYQHVFGPSGTKFRNYAAYARIGWIIDQTGVTEDRTYISNIFFGEFYASQIDLNNTTTTANSALSTASAAQTGVADINNNLTDNYSTTAQMHLAIDQKADSITQSVSETYATVSHDHDSAYATVSHNHDDLYKSINFYPTYMPTLSGGTGTSIQFWKGTQVQYDALPSKNSGVFYIIIED